MNLRYERLANIFLNILLIVINSHFIILQNSISDPSCYELIDDNIRENAKFWLEGVAILVVGVFGLLGNLISIFVFRRSRGNKGFHTLLIM